MVEIDGLVDIELIGGGGFADVYRARDSAHERDVAVKVIRAATDSEAMLRVFRRERVAMGRLGEHEGIVSVHRSGVTSGGHPYLVMPLFECSLADVLAHGPLAEPEAARVMMLVGQAIQFAHENSVVHRDLKPANILMSARGRPVVADFGVSTLVNSVRTLNSVAAQMTPEYSSPGVIMGRPVSPADDVYSLGATLFSCLSSRAPFEATSLSSANVYATMRRIVEDDLEDLRLSGISDDVCRIVERAMSKDPAERFQSAAAFADALSDLAMTDGGSELAGVRRRVGDSAATRRFIDPTPTVQPPAEQSSPRRPIAIGLVAVLMLATVAAVGLWDWRSGAGGSSSASTQAGTSDSSTGATSADVESSTTHDGIELSEAAQSAPTTIGEPEIVAVTSATTTTPTVTSQPTATTSRPQRPTATADTATVGTTAAPSSTETTGTAESVETVQVTTSSSVSTTPLVVVPSVARLTGEQAVIRLGQSGLDASCGTRCADRVVATAPPAGTEIEPGSTVELKY